MAAKAMAALVFVGAALGVRAGELCLALVPGTEPEEVLEAGKLSLKLIWGREVTLSVGTDPLLIVEAEPGRLLGVLKGISPRPTRGRTVPVLEACLGRKPESILLITAEDPDPGLLPLFPELGRKGTRLFVLYSAEEDFPAGAISATGGAAIPFEDLQGLFLGVLEATSRIEGVHYRNLGTWTLDPLNPVPLEGRGELFLVSATSLNAFIVTERGRRVPGEFIQGGLHFIYRFELPGGKVHLVSPRYAVAEAFLSFPRHGFPWYLVAISMSGAGVLILSARIALKAVQRRGSFAIALQISGRRRIIRVPPSGLVLGKGEDPLVPEEPMVELKPVDGRLEARPLGGEVELNGFPLEGPVSLSALDRLAFGEAEVIVLSAEEGR